MLNNEEMNESVKLTANLWQQLFNGKPKKFRFSQTNEFVHGTLDVVCVGNGDCYLSIFYADSNRVLGLPQGNKLRVTQTLLEKISWAESEKCFLAIF